MERKKYPCGVGFIDGKPVLRKGAKFGGIKYFCKESNINNITGSWLKEYKCFITDFRINNIFGDELMNFCIIFKFSNGFGAIVEFQSDNTKTLDQNYMHTIEINVEMLDKNGERFTEESFEKNRIDGFPDKHRKMFVLPYQVELFLKEVKAI